MPFPIDPPWGTEWIGASARERGAALVDLLATADALPQGAPLSAESVLTVDQALQRAEIPHAIGGGLALSYYGEPRMTMDIDVNVFVPPTRRPEVEHALGPLGHDNPVHLFFSEDALHEAMPAAVRCVPLADGTIPIVSPEHLIIRKAMLDRPKDWLDIEAILVAETPLDLKEIRTWLARLAGRDDPRLTKLHEMALQRRP
jgi:hypothetical protein